MQLYQLSSLVCGHDDYFNRKNYFERLRARAHTHFKYDSKVVKNLEGCQKSFYFYLYHLCEQNLLLVMTIKNLKRP